jgi:VWFA-related protein
MRKNDADNLRVSALPVKRARCKSGFGVAFYAHTIPDRGYGFLVTTEVFMREFQRQFWLIVWLILTGCSNMTMAQTPAPPQQAKEQEPQIRIVTNEVRLPLRAFDPFGKPVTDLTPRDIVVIEDGASCPVTSLRLEPANVLLVLDLSNTLGIFKSGRNEDEKKRTDWTNYSVIARPAAQEFAESLMRGLAAPDHVAILQYADRVELLQDWTRNRDEAINALRAKFRAGLKAHFYDALTAAAAQLQSAPAGRRVLVLVSDGVDTASVAAKERAFEQVMATGASVFVVSWTGIVLGEAQRAQKASRHAIKSSEIDHGWQVSLPIWSSSKSKRKAEIKQYTERTNKAAEDLKTLAAESGGEYWLPAQFSELSAKPRELIREIGTQYTLTYLSKKDQIDRATAVAEIRLARPGLTARTRQAVKVKSAAR